MPFSTETYACRAGAVLDYAAEAGLLLLQAGPDVLRFVRRPSTSATKTSRMDWRGWQSPCAA